MDHLLGGQPPYATVILLWGLTVDPIVGPYVRGRLVLAGLGDHTPVADWFDAVHAVAADVPTDRLTRIAEEIAKKWALIDPDWARKNWGRTELHRALSGKMGKEQRAPEQGRGRNAPVRR